MKLNEPQGFEHVGPDMDEFIHAGRFERRDVISRITGKHHDDLGHGRMKQRYEYGDKGGIVVIRGADDGDPGAGFAEGGGKPGPNGTGQSGKLKPIAGYPEDKKLAWRNANDETFIKAANDFNQRNGLKPGDPRYIDPQMMKAWAMVESGGEGDKAQFLSDPFQVNKPLDWVDAKATQAGLTKWQKMTPAESARAGLEWLRYKSEIHDTSGGVARMLGVQQSLERYNGRSDHSPQSGKQTHKVWYAATIMALAKQP